MLIVTPPVAQILDPQGHSFHLQTIKRGYSQFVFMHARGCVQPAVDLSWFDKQADRPEYMRVVLEPGLDPTTISRAFGGCRLKVTNLSPLCAVSVLPIA